MFLYFFQSHPSPVVNKDFISSSSFQLQTQNQPWWSLTYFLTWWLKSAPIDGLILFHLRITYLPLDACISRVHALVMWVYDVELFFGYCAVIYYVTQAAASTGAVSYLQGFYLLSQSRHRVTNDAQPRWVTRGLTVTVCCRWQVKEAQRGVFTDWLWGLKHYSSPQRARVQKLLINSE